MTYGLYFIKLSFTNNWYASKFDSHFTGRSKLFNNDITAKPLKTLMLLHGLSSDETTYMRYTSIERYANEHKLAVIMPNVDHSAYANMAYGHSYYDYILEVYDYVHQIFPLSKKA